MARDESGLHERIRRDVGDLHRFGYAQQLFREMGGFANFAVSFTLISIPTGLLTTYAYGLTNAGPAAEGLGWPLVTLFSLAVAASMAEIASAIPTAGAMYHWSALLGGPGWGWFTAWFNLVGQMAITAGIDYGIVLTYKDSLGLHGAPVLLAAYALILLSHGLLNHYGIRIVSLLNDVSAWYHMALILFMTGAFLFAAKLQPLSFAFHTGFTLSGFPYGWAFLVALLQAQWTLTGYDASAHITEETVDPRRNAPWGMFLAVLVSGVVGYVLLLAFTLGIRDLPAAAAAANPVGFIADSALGPTLGKVFLWSVFPAMWFCGLSSVTANSRMIFAFARDQGLPGSGLWARVSPKYRTPAAAVWFSVVVAFLVAVYSEQAYSVITSLATIGLYISYILPVALVLRERARGRWTELGPWNLGRWGAWVNAAAVLWTLLITALFVSPPNALTGETFAAMTALLALLYAAFARGRFKGPRRQASEAELRHLEEALLSTSVYHEA